jgi:anti-sigma-K factor RskA
MTDNDINNNDLSLLAGAYALGALNADDAHRYEEYLAQREEARTEATQLEDTAARLGLASLEVQPTPALKSNLMALIAVTPQLPAIAPEDAPAVGSAQQVSSAPQKRETDGSAVTPSAVQASDAAATGSAPDNAAPAPVRPLHATGSSQPAAGSGSASAPAGPPSGSTASFASRPTASRPAASRPTASRPASSAQSKAQARWFQKPVAFLAAAAAVVAVFLGASSLTGMLNNGNQVQQALALASINAQPDVQRSTVPLTANDDGGESSTATLVWSENIGQSVLLVNGLEQLPDDKVYELWYIDGEGSPISAGLFTIPDSGHTYSVLDGEMTAGATVGVTVEPAGGSKQPTTAPVIAIPTA